MAVVLIADDEPHIVELVRVTLEDDRLRVHEASDGVEALALAELLRPDIILLDVEMPGLTGLEVCRRLRADERFARTPVVMLTAAAQREDVARGFEAGATEYLTKPFSPIGLLNLVEQLVPAAMLWLPER